MTFDHFNKLSPAEAERLAMLAEECGEVIQAVGKILRHGYASRHPDGGPDNRATLQREVNDVQAIMLLMSEAGDLKILRSFGDHTAALERKMAFTHHQERVW